MSPPFKRRGKAWGSIEEYIAWCESQLSGLSNEHRSRTFIQSAHAYWTFVTNQTPPNYQIQVWEAIAEACESGRLQPAGFATTRKLFFGDPAGYGYDALMNEAEAYHSVLPGCKVWYTEYNAREAGTEKHQAVFYGKMMLDLARLHAATGKVEALHYHEGFKLQAERLHRQL